MSSLTNSIEFVRKYVSSAARKLPHCREDIIQDVFLKWTEEFGNDYPSAEALSDPRSDERRALIRIVSNRVRTSVAYIRRRPQQLENESLQPAKVFSTELVDF